MELKIPRQSFAGYRSGFTKGLGQPVTRIHKDSALLIPAFVSRLLSALSGFQREHLL